MRVEVTWEDVVTGRHGEAGQCAIAKAINRKYPQYTSVKVGERTIGFSDKTKRIRYTLATPLTAERFVKQFDKDQAEPGLAFNLRLEEAVVTAMPDTLQTREATRRARSVAAPGVKRKPRASRRRKS